MSHDRLQVKSAEETGLAGAIDQLLHVGVVVAGDLVLSVAGIDLVYCSLRLMLTSADRYYELLEENRLNTVGNHSKHG